MKESSLSCLYRRPILTVTFYSCFASEDNFCTLYEVEDGKKKLEPVLGHRDCDRL